MKKLFRSYKTSGSAFSCIVKDALVCKMFIFKTPFNNLFYLSPAAKALQNKILDQGKYDDNWYGDR